ncbi:hypothetical protein TNIN_275221 [Trichonephila inaurata madagascariensis]|uniref:Uncharacterized protein n=1 Tax=Trichonephila inaurata madagascariensis TaxID=2747483 RepID=A0A8X7CN17_9ARAC|nr:hypothetical protein TNIN_275221 [Trichonephila inaurata madagascariensis]
MWVKFAPHTLKPQGSYFSSCTKRDVYGLDIPSRVETFLPGINILDASRILYHLDLTSVVSKSRDCAAALFGVGMETICNQFPLETWIHIHTNVPKLEIYCLARAGVYYEHLTHYPSLGTVKTTFNGEYNAIKVALANLKYSFFIPIILSSS